MWEDFRWEVGVIEQRRDDFIAEIVSRGRARGSGIELSQPLVWVFTIPEARATRILLCRDREAALEALRA